MQDDIYSQTFTQIVLGKYALFLLKTPFLMSVISLIFGLVFFGITRWFEQVSNLFLIFSIISFAACVISIFISIFQIIRRKKQKIKFEKSIMNSDLEQVYDLTSDEFEQWVVRLLELDGYKARVTTINREHGVNIIATKNYITVVINVNRSAEPLGLPSVKQIIAGKEHYRTVQGWIISTTPTFTTEAIKLAENKRIKLFNYNDLSEYLHKIQNNNNRT